MDKKYYLQELDKLRKLSQQFASQYPAIADRLVEPSVDSEVEHLLQGLAFLGADIQYKIDQGFPELLENLMSVVCPDLIKPIPSYALLSFSASMFSSNIETIQAGTLVESKSSKKFPEVVKFSISRDTTVLPIKCTNFLCYNNNLHSSLFRMEFEAKAGLENLNFNKLPLYLHGEYTDTSDIYYLLNNHLSAITIRSAGKAISLDITALKASSFTHDKMAYHASMNDIPTFNLLYDYFISPNKFMLCELDLSSIKSQLLREDFVIDFEVNTEDMEIGTEHNIQVLLNVAVATNTFQLKEYVVTNELRHDEILLNVTDMDGQLLKVISVDKLVGISKNNRGNRTQYHKFSTWSKNQLEPVYQTRFNKVGMHDNAMLSIAYPPAYDIDLDEVLLADVTVTQGEVAQKLPVGSIVVRREGISETIDFTNITKPTTYIASIKNKQLPHLASHLSFSISANLTLEEIKSMIKRYIPEDKEALVRIYNKKIEGIVGVKVQSGSQLYESQLLTGQEVTINVVSTNFASIGDLYILGGILNAIFSAITAINSYTKLTIVDNYSGEIMSWPAQIGVEQSI